jgi:predicted transcriptional regulator
MTKIETRKGKLNRARLTVQLSSELLEAVELRAEEEAIPPAVFVRRAVTRLVNEHERTGVLSRREVAGFGEARRRGRRGPMRQWPKAVSYVADPHIAEGLKALAEDNRVDVSTLAREAIVCDLDRPSTLRRAAPRDEFGFTTSGAPQKGRAAQHIMDETWRSTNE